MKQHVFLSLVLALIMLFPLPNASFASAASESPDYQVLVLMLKNGTAVTVDIVDRALASGEHTEEELKKLFEEYGQEYPTRSVTYQAVQLYLEAGAEVPSDILVLFEQDTETSEEAKAALFARYNQSYNATTSSPDVPAETNLSGNIPAPESTEQPSVTIPDFDIAEGKWKAGTFVDEFRDLTQEKFIYVDTVGTFSNMAAHDEILSVRILVDWQNIEIYMLEYGRYELSLIGSNKYTIRIRDGNNTDHEFTGTLHSSTGRIQVDLPTDTAQGTNPLRAELISIFSLGGNIRFSITEESGSSRYFFSVNDADNFAAMRKQAASIAVNYLGRASEGIIPFTIGDKMGAINLSGDVIVPCEYDVVFHCKNGMIMVYNGESITLDGGEKTASGEGKYGFYTQDGEMVVPLTYERAKDFNGGVAFVRKNSKYGAVDTMGNSVIPFSYDYVFSSDSEIALTFTGTLNRGYPDKGTYTFVTPDGSVIYETTEDASAFSENRAAVRIGGKYGYIDPSGNLVVEAIWDDASSFKNGLAWVVSGGTYSAIDPDGNTVVICKKPGKEIGYIGDFHDGFAWVDDTKYRYGAIDSSGKQVIKCQYKYMTDFLGGYAGAENEKEKYGIIDRKGKTVVPFQYDKISLCGNYFRVRKYATKNQNGFGIGGTYGLINEKGESVLDMKYTNIQYGDGYYTVSTDTKWQILDEALNPVFESK